MRWHLSHRADPRALPIADRHYNRQKPGTPQFVPPGRCIVLLTADADALWVSSWPFAEYVKHSWAGAWVNSCFRNEAPHRYLSSELVAEALAVTRYVWGEPPPMGLVTFIDRSKTRRKRDPGRCYVKAGGTRLRATTRGGLTVIQFLPDAIPAALAPIGGQPSLWGAA